ncbi:MAG: ureidoglycolate lyase [Alteromonadaceae bacterium]|jgi:ureidoglycolate lyase
MTSTKLVVKPLTQEGFAVFGDVIEANDRANHYSINDGNTERYHDLAKVDVNAKSGHTLVNIFRSNPLPQPIGIKMMERHPLGSQAFMPLSHQSYLVVVAPPGEFNVELIEAFLAGASQGVNYHPGTWHHYCLALNHSSDFMVIDRGGDGDNCDVVTLDGSLVIDLAEV